jgi:hypothetical protein
VNVGFVMVRPNKTKPEGYMRPLDVPGGYPPYLTLLKDAVGRGFESHRARLSFCRALHVGVGAAGLARSAATPSWRYLAASRGVYVFVGSSDPCVAVGQLREASPYSVTLSIEIDV